MKISFAAIVLLFLAGCSPRVDLARALPGHYAFEAVGAEWADEPQVRRSYVEIDKDWSVRAAHLPSKYSSLPNVVNSGKVIWSQSQCDPFEDVFGTFCLTIAWDDAVGKLNVDRVNIGRDGRFLTLERQNSDEWVRYRAVDD